jgi:hypothetical protein
MSQSHLAEQTKTMERYLCLVDLIKEAQAWGFFLSILLVVILDNIVG